MTAAHPPRRWAVIAVAAAVLGWIGVVPGLGLHEQRALGLAVFALVLWTARSVPVELTSLAVLVLLPLSGLTDFGTAFAPLGGSTVWLVFAGMVLSRLLSETGLGARLADAAVPHLVGHPLRLIAGLHLLGLAAAFLVPSGVVRVLLLVPVGLALCKVLDPAGRDEGLRTAATLSIACGTYFGGCAVLTGSVPNLVVAGQLEAATGRVIYWGEWLLWMFPVLGALRTVLSIAVVWVVCGRHLSRSTVADVDDLPPPQPMAPRQWRGLAVIGVGVALWASDVVHGLPPVLVGLLLVLAAVLPRWGPLAVDDLKSVDYPFFLYIAALFGVGHVLDATGFNGRMVAAVSAALPDAGGHWLGESLTLTMVTVPLDFLMDIAAVGAVATPTLLTAGAAAGLSPVASALSVAMATTVAFLPYQAAPFMVVLGMGAVRARPLATAMFAISTVSLLLLTPLSVAYWRWLGLL